MNNKFKYIFLASFLLTFHLSSCRKKLKTNNISNKNNNVKYKVIEELKDTVAVFPDVLYPAKCSEIMTKYVYSIVEKGYNVLEIGTGTGLQGIIAAKKGAKNVTSLDIKPQAVSNALYNSKKFSVSHITNYKLMDQSSKNLVFGTLDINTRFDLIIFNEICGQTPKEFSRNEFNAFKQTLFNDFTKMVKIKLKVGGHILLLHDLPIDSLNKMAKKEGLKINLLERVNTGPYSCSVFFIVELP